MFKNELLEIWNKRIEVVLIKDLKFNIVPFKVWLNETLLPLPPAWSGAHDSWNGGNSDPYSDSPTIPIEKSGKLGFGGWSVLGPTDKYTSGWYPNGILNSYGRVAPADFTSANVKTDVCTGPMLSFVQTLEQNGIFLSRARVTITKPNQGIQWHNDSNYPGELIVRIQFPIESNKKHFFHSETQRWQLVDDGQVYMLNTNHQHKTVNDGHFIRFNLIADVDVSRLPNEDIYEILPGEKFYE